MVESDLEEILVFLNEVIIPSVSIKAFIWKVRAEANGIITSS